VFLYQNSCQALNQILTCALQPPRRSYERPVRSYRELHSDEESLSEDEACSRKRAKRTKKARKEEVGNKSIRWICHFLSLDFEEEIVFLHLSSLKICLTFIFPLGNC